MSIISALRRSRSANECRYTDGGVGHVESYFLRANDPDRPRAIWLKATILASLEGPPSAETWCIWFDGEKNRTWAHRATRTLKEAVFPTPTSGRIETQGATFELGARGSSKGSLSRGDEECLWDIGWTREIGPLGEPLSIFPHPAMVEGPFPKSKLLTPYPTLRFDGSVNCFGERVEISGWRGMQGHNWGREHAFEYAWGQCLFPASDDAPAAMVEGFTGRIKLAGRPSPRMSALVVRRGTQTYRFDRTFDFWRQDATLDDFRWAVRLAGPDGVMRLEMKAADRPIACLGYRNPDGRLSYCFNSKLAETTLSVEPTKGAAFEYRSAHGGALEFLRTKSDPRYPNIV